jgi:hypothetical protein
MVAQKLDVAGDSRAGFSQIDYQIIITAID